MPDQLISALSQAGVIAALGLAGALIFRKSFRPGWFVGALALYVVYDFLLLRGYGAVPQVPGADWNWSGKLMSFAVMLAVAALPIFGWRRTGVTLAHRPGSWLAFLVFAALSGLFVYFAFSGADGRSDWETIAFQWTMPGLDEELFYRGVLLIAMNEAFTRKVSILGAPVGYGGLLTSVLFGLAHGLGYHGGEWWFEWMTVALTGGPSLILLWVREKTGSLLLPVLGHNIANGADTLI